MDTTDEKINELTASYHYYPFGMMWEGGHYRKDPNNPPPTQGNFFAPQDVKNKYRYNGKEFIEDFDIGLNDYGVRWYDPRIGLFLSVDPLADKFPHVNVFNYAENSPIAHIDLWGLQAVFFQVAGRVGLSGSVIPGPTASAAVGVAIDAKANVLVYHTESAGAGFGAFAGAGAEVGVNFGVDDIDGLLGYGLNFGAVVGVSPLGGPQLGVEGNISISTEKNEGDLLGLPTGEGDNGGGGTGAIPQLGGAIGFFGYADISYTSEIARFSGGDLKSAGQELINLISSQFGELSNDQQTEILNQIEALRNYGPLNTNDTNSCNEECKE